MRQLREGESLRQPTPVAKWRTCPYIAGTRAVHPERHVPSSAHETKYTVFIMRLIRSIFVLGLLPLSFATVGGCSCDDGTSDDSNNNRGGAGGAGGGTGNTGGDLFPGGNGGFGATGTGASGGVGGVNEDCLFIPDPGQFEPALDCEWTGPAPGSPYQALDDVVSTPVVINLTDDNNDLLVNTNDIPDIAFISYQLQTGGACPPATTCGCCNSSGALRVVSGGCNADGSMTEHFSVGATEIEADIGVPGIWLDSSGGLAAGDIDDDGSVDLVATTRLGGTIAFERDGTVKWYQPAFPKGDDHLAGTQPSIANLDGVGPPEIIQGRVVLNGEDGSLDWEGDAGVGTNGFMGPVSVVGDLDRNGTSNVLAGGTMYDFDGTPMWTYNFPVAITSGNCAAGGFPCDGFTATGDFDADPEGEVVIIRAGTIYVLNHDGSEMMVGGTPAIIDVPVAGCGKNEGGPPTVADFDGDGEAEIGVAGANFYVVADMECLATPLPAQCSDPGIRWKLPNADCSSRVTGSSVFDFDGDGKAEVVYNDEQLFRILDGDTGAVLLSVPNISHTRLEMPIVADVDNDGNAEILFIENGWNTNSQGIRVWADATDTWVPTRRIWNQHSYHVTNVDEVGGIPLVEPVNWLESSASTVSGVMNNFRQNLPAFDVFAAPDLSVTVNVDKSLCPAQLGLAAKVCNTGAIQVGAGVEVKFYDNSDMSEINCANSPVTTTAPMPPGSCETVTCLINSPPMDPTVVDVRACVDNAGYECGSTGGMGGAGGGGPQNGGNNECNEENNASDTAATGCEGAPN